MDVTNAVFFFYLGVLFGVIEKWNEKILYIILLVLMGISIVCIGLYDTRIDISFVDFMSDVVCLTVGNFVGEKIYEKISGGNNNQ